MPVTVMSPYSSEQKEQKQEKKKSIHGSTELLLLRNTAYDNNTLKPNCKQQPKTN